MKSIVTNSKNNNNYFKHNNAMLRKRNKFMYVVTVVFSQHCINNERRYLDFFFICRFHTCDPIAQKNNITITDLAPFW